jgi:hypothetical protein
MKKNYLLLFLFLSIISFSFNEYYVFTSLGVPTVEDVYGGRINSIDGYQFHPDSTRIFIATESANSVFYADVLANSGAPSVDAFTVVPSLDNTQDFGSNIQTIGIHEGSETFYFLDMNKELQYTTISSSSVSSTMETGIDDFLIEDDYAFTAGQGSGEIDFGTLDASNNYTPGTGSPITFAAFTNFSKMYIGSATDKMYIFTPGMTPNLYISSDDYNAFSGSTSFADISPTLTSTGVNWSAFGIAPDGRFFLGGTDNMNKYIAYSDDNGTTWTEFSSGIVGTSAGNFDFSGNATSYYVLFASMFNNNNGISGSWAKFGTTSHYTNANDGSVFVDPVNEDIFYSTSDQGFGVSYDLGATVVSADEGIEAVQVNDMEMTVDKSTGWIASKSGIRKVTDYDTSSPVWTNAMFPNGDGSPYYSVAMEPSDNATAYVGNLRIYKTINSGLAWSQVFTPESAPYNYPMVGTYTNALTICPFDENIVFAGIEIQDSDKGGLFVSEDAGSSWSQIYLQASSGSNDVDVNDIVFTQESGNIVAYIGVQYDLTTPTGRSIYRVEQGSSSWTVTQDMNSGTTSTGTTIVVSINDLDYDAINNTVYATGTDAGTNHPVSYYKPLSGTGLWTVNTSSGFPTSTAMINKVGRAIVHDGTNTLYCAVDHEIYYLTSGASVWTLGYSYPIGTEINCLFYDELLVGTGTGLYAQADPSTASITDENLVTVNIYPNPIENGSKLKINLNQKIINPTFRITDLRGQLIQEFQLYQIQTNGTISTIDIPLSINRGMYLLSVYNKKKKMSTKKLIIN